ncbi:MAG: NrtA/SsuA/CpmA family ABC transporter substrate-binding protein [Polyangiales bacterium]
MTRTLSAVVLATSLALVGCEKAKPPAPSTASEYEPITIRFSAGHNYGVFAYAEKHGILERELAKVNAKIEWVPAAGAFSANFEAMNSGAINTSGGAISPIIGALSHNLQFKIFAIGDPSDMRQAGIVAPKGSAIKKIEDLKGKRVAVNLAAHGDYLLLKALANHGVPAESVERVPIQPPEAAAAFATGKIDAWSTFGVFFATAKNNGANILAYEADLDSDDVSVSAANVALLEKNPAAFQVLVRVQSELAQQAHEHPEQFTNVFTDKGPTAFAGERLDISLAEQRSTPPQRVPTAADKQRVANVAKIFTENKSIDRAIPVDDIVFDIDAAAARKKTAQSATTPIETAQR